MNKTQFNLQTLFGGRGGGAKSAGTVRSNFGPALTNLNLTSALRLSSLLRIKAVAIPAPDDPDGISRR